VSSKGIRDIPAGQVSSKEERDVDPRRNIIKAALIIVASFLLMVVLRFTLKDLIEGTAQDIAELLSYPGMFLVTMAMDTLIDPFTPDIVLFLALSGDFEPLLSVLFISLGSIIGGHIGYQIGRSLGHTRFVRRVIGGYMVRGRLLFSKYGLFAVILAAFTPIPFSTVCWIAGIFEMDRRLFFIGTLWRVPRFLLWFLVLGLGYKGLGI
jgi:membrane protein YqaA with SNARE-associated domain